MVQSGKICNQRYCGNVWWFETHARGRHVRIGRYFTSMETPRRGFGNRETRIAEWPCRTPTLVASSACRPRLANQSRNALAFLKRASIRLMPPKLGKPSGRLPGGLAGLVVAHEHRLGLDHLHAEHHAAILVDQDVAGQDVERSEEHTPELQPRGLL